MLNKGFAPRDVFEKILGWAVIPTFDLILEYNDQGIILVKRRIAPYKDHWALPGLRMFKGEEINDTLRRIANQEVGLRIDPEQRRFLGQYVGKFRTEKHRQDLSTGYSVKVLLNQEILLNKNHFSDLRLIDSKEGIPSRTGAMYRFYLERYFEVN